MRLKLERGGQSPLSNFSRSMSERLISERGKIKLEGALAPLPFYFPEFQKLVSERLIFRPIICTTTTFKCACARTRTCARTRVGYVVAQMGSNVLIWAPNGKIMGPKGTLFK